MTQVNPEGTDTNGTLTSPLYISFHGRVLEHLGIQMYQSPVNALAEFVANAWDAEASEVNVYLPDEITDDSTIVISDDGIGMTREECQNKFLCVGYNRRRNNPNEKSQNLQRTILGRKGIGKFAGFGIAGSIRIDTISATSNIRTVFELNLDDLIGEEYIGTDNKPVREIVDAPQESKRINGKGTVIILSGLKLKQEIRSDFPKSMARRFLLLERQTGFKVTINGSELPRSLSLENIEFSFPRDYANDEKPSDILSVDPATGFGEERLPNGQSIKWRILFHKTTIDEEELRGVTVYAKGKLVQAPFLFHLTGGLGGQHGVEYLTGQIEADYLDCLEDDITTTERQRINWENEEAAALLEWGKARIRRLLRIWHNRRGEGRSKEIEEKVAPFSSRLEKLEPHEKRTVTRALKKLCTLASLDEDEFSNTAEAILLSWEQGRLHELIDEISTVEDFTEQKLLSILLESQTLTALSTAEAVKTKLRTVGGLKLHITRKELEKGVRDYIANNPWLISPEWETFQVERTISKLIKDAAEKAELEKDENWKGRIDLVLASGNQLLILEFMRPGLKLNWDHIYRFERYVIIIREMLKANTASQYKYAAGYLIADGLIEDTGISAKIQDLKENGMLVMDWHTLFSKAMATWNEFLKILVSRAPDDERIQALLD
jgi:hypothetical protein